MNAPTQGYRNATKPPGPPVPWGPSSVGLAWMSSQSRKLFEWWLRRVADNEVGCFIFRIAQEDNMRALINKHGPPHQSTMPTLARKTTRITIMTRCQGRGPLWFGPRLGRQPIVSCSTACTSASTMLLRLHHRAPRLTLPHADCIFSFFTLRHARRKLCPLCRAKLPGHIPCRKTRPLTVKLSELIEKFCEENNAGLVVDHSPGSPREPMSLPNWPFIFHGGTARRRALLLHRTCRLTLNCYETAKVSPAVRCLHNCEYHEGNEPQSYANRLQLRPRPLSP